MSITRKKVKEEFKNIQDNLNNLSNENSSINNKILKNTIKKYYNETLKYLKIFSDNKTKESDSLEEIYEFVHKINKTVIKILAKKRKFLFGGEEDLDEDEESDLLSIQEKPPDYIQKAFSKYFSPDNTFIKDQYYLEKSEIYGESLATKNIIEKGEIIGRYTGKVIYLKPTVTKSQSKYIMDFKIWNNLIYIDAINSWAGKMNHKWIWPWYDLDIPMPPEWTGFFANVIIVEQDAEISALTEIKKNHELFIDYHKSYWVDKDQKPGWFVGAWQKDLSVLFKGPLDFKEEYITFTEALKEYKDLRDLIDQSIPVYDKFEEFEAVTFHKNY